MGQDINRDVECDMDREIEQNPSRSTGRQLDKIVTVLGKRRAGKTRFLLENYPDSHYLCCTDDTSLNLLHRLDPQSSGWSEFLERTQGTLILDDFPKLARAEDCIIEIVENKVRQTPNLQVVVSGSDFQFFEQLPWTTELIQIDPHAPWELREFFSELDAISQMELYACLGGSPHYWECYDPTRSLSDNLWNLVLDPKSPLHDEPRLLLSEELRELRIYFALMGAIARGHHQMQAIANACQLTSQAAGRYLDQLTRRRWVERSVPVTEDLQLSRRGHYQLVDPFFRFWFRFVYPKWSQFQAGLGEEVLRQDILPNLEEFVASNFRETCQNWLRLHLEALPFADRSAAQVGSWWNASLDLDLVAYNEEEVLFARCLWREEPPQASDLIALKVYSSAAREFEHHKKHYGLFSKRPTAASLTNGAQFDLVSMFARTRRL